jgi:hypothetical protein
MHAMQYEITLPADYDMQIIRERVHAAAPMLDDRAGLGLKAYLIRQAGRAGSPVNQYAPFYLWHDVGMMGHFLAGGGGFERITRAFGRPRVRHWTGLARFPGPAAGRGAVPRAATRRVTAVPVDPDPQGAGLAEFVEREIENLRALARHEGVHTAALAFDPYGWQLVRFVLGEAPPAAAADEAPDAERYEVLHVSAPHLADLPEGRHW